MPRGGMRLLSITADQGLTRVNQDTVHNDRQERSFYICMLAIFFDATHTFLYHDSNIFYTLPHD